MTGSTFGFTPNNTLATNIYSSETTMWGIGLNQAIDAAAMDLYVNYQHYSFDSAKNSTGGDVFSSGIKDFQAVMTGGIIRF